MIYFLNFRLIIERWIFKTSKLDTIAAGKASTVVNFNDKKIKLKMAMQTQKTAILTFFEIAISLCFRCISLIMRKLLV